MTDRHYLELLAKDYPTIAAASSEIINLNAICCLPKGTEYFFSEDVYKRQQVGVVIRPEKQIKNTIFLCCYAKKSAHIALYPPFSSLWPNPFVCCLKKERRHRSVSPRAV